MVASLDTTRHFVAPEPVPDGEHLVGRVAVAVPPGRFQYRLAIQQGEESGLVLPRDSVRVGGPMSTGLALSDLVLGSRATNLMWRRSEADTVLFNPLETFKRSEEMQLYYEVSGLQPGRPYEVRLAVKKQGGGGGVFKKIFGGGGAAMSLKFDAHATEPLESAHRGLQLERLKPGSYVLEVTVTDDQGRKDRAVPALPGGEGVTARLERPGVSGRAWVRTSSGWTSVSALTCASTCTRCWVMPALVSNVAMCIRSDARGRSNGSALLFSAAFDRRPAAERDTGMAEEPERRAVERLEQSLVEGQALPVQRDQPQGGVVAVAAGMDHEAVGEGGILAGRPAEGRTQLLLAEGDRVIRDHGVSGRA